MDILEKIDGMKKSRGWTEYQLALESGLRQSTISSWYRKKMTPSIPSLKHICKAFGISLSQFFMDDDEEAVVLSEQQKKLVHVTARMSPEQVDTLLEFLQSL